MFTFINAKRDAIFFNVSLKKIYFDSRDDDTVVVSIVIAQEGESDNNIVVIGTFQMNDAIIDGLSSLDKWMEGGVHSISNIRSYLEGFSSRII